MLFEIADNLSVTGAASPHEVRALQRALLLRAGLRQKRRKTK
jgi:hypothetical protein